MVQSLLNTGQDVHSDLESVDADESKIEIVQEEIQLPQTETPSQVDESVRRKRPLLIIDIDTGENQKDRIELFKDDDPVELAKRFCEKHDYDQSTFETLHTMIEERLKKALKKMELKRREKKR